MHVAAHFLASLVVLGGVSCGIFDIPQRDPVQDVIQQVSDVATGRRELRFKGNILDGTAEISTGYTNEEIMTVVAAVGGILLVLVCCGVFCKHCCCPNKQPTVIMYQQMPPQQRPPPRSPITLPGVHSIMMPVRNSNNGYSEMASQQAPGTPPPPPYPGIHA